MLQDATSTVYIQAEIDGVKHTNSGSGERMGSIIDCFMFTMNERNAELVVIVLPFGTDCLVYVSVDNA